MDLTDEQKAVVAHDFHRHGRIAAGPGTGKSTTAVALVDRLLKLQAPPRVRFLTFTRAATAELAKKILGMPDLAVERPSTIHSFSISVLVRNPGAGAYPKPLRIADPWERHFIVRPDLARRVGADVYRIDELERLMAAKWESLEDEEHAEISPEERERFRGAFLEHRRTYGYTLLAELPDLLRVALLEQGHLDGLDYHLLLLDEYQDLNACDLEVVRLVGNQGTSIVAVGDDDQSIYSFRKAAPAGFRRFHDDYPDSDEYPLSEAKRSARLIVDWGQFVIAGDPGRGNRTVLHASDDADDGVVALLRFPTDESEAKSVAQLVEALRRREVVASEILVLTRTDHRGMFTEALRREMTALEIPVQNPGALDAMMADPANRRFVAIARLIVNRRDSLAWRTLFRLGGGAGEKFFDHFFQAAVGQGITFADVLADEADGGFAHTPPRFRRLVEPIWNSTCALLDAVEGVQQDLDATWPDRLRKFMAAVEAFPKPTDALWELMDEVAAQSEPDLSLGRFIGELHGLGRDILQSSSKGVRVMTMQASKGLTVTATIVLGVESGLIPRPGEDLNEERRLLYVAMTRSRQYLFLTWAQRRAGPAARAGEANFGARRPTDFLRNGPVGSQDGETYVEEFSVDVDDQNVD